ncbi:hypothetical protein [Psychromarinibacter sp. S121]|uniref:hypothetical protein n=1 Tax=Psychromarinibacter sp. S121 TaxID=3415127 RepID=UPI003C7DAA33
MRRTITQAVALAAMLTGTQVLADGSTDMCLDMSGTDEDQCACAEETLAGTLAAEDYDLYTKIGTLYIANMAAGQEMADAWDAGLELVANEHGLGTSDLRSRMNDAGKAHREAIDACG